MDLKGGPRGCLQRTREEFKIQKLGVSYEDPVVFVKPQCFVPSIYLCWCVFWTMYYMAMLSLEGYYNQHSGPEWFTKLTCLSYIIQSVLVFLDCGVTVYVNVKRRDIRDGVATEMPWYMKLLWVIFNISNTASIIVSVLYHTLLTPYFNHASLNKHLFNSVYTVLLLAFSAKPVQILHVYQPMLYLTLYGVFSVIYQKTGNDAIYAPLDWDKAGTTIITVVLVIFVAVPVVHLLCYGIYTLRVFISQTCVSRSTRTVAIAEDKNISCDTKCTKKIEACDTSQYVNKCFEGE